MTTIRPRVNSLALVLVVVAPRAAVAQSHHPVAPSPVFELATLGTAPAFGGYVSVRGTRRNDSLGAQVNRGRLTMLVAPRPFLGIRMQGDLSSGQLGRLRDDGTTSGFTLTDAYVELAPPAGSAPRFARWHPALLIGQFKQPFSLEYLTSFAYLETANRAQVVDRESPKRDIGAMAQVGIGRWVRLDASITQGEGPNATANPDGRELAIGRLTATPFRWLALGGALGNEGPDHLRGWDARVAWRRLVLEGEALHRSRPTSDSTHADAGGGYALAAYRLLPWLEPVYKLEYYLVTTHAPTADSDERSTWSTVGVNLLTRDESLRVEMDWIFKSERRRPVRNDEVDVQIIANF